MTWIDELLAHPLQRQALGRTLRLMRVPTGEVLKPGPRRFWYRGANQYFDVFLDVRDGEVFWCQFTLRGLSMTWDTRSRILRTDVTGEMNVSGTPVSAAALLYGLRSVELRRFVLLALLILEQADDEPLFADVAQQLRDKLAESEGASEYRATV